MQCPKCGGKGSIDCYGHIANGVCFLCNGRGIVASNGKAVRSVKLAQIRLTLPGLSKRDMKLIIDDSLCNVLYVEFDQSAVWANKYVARYAKFVACGLYTASKGKGRTIRFTPNFKPSTFETLIDWSN